MLFFCWYKSFILSSLLLEISCWLCLFLLFCIISVILYYSCKIFFSCFKIYQINKTSFDDIRNISNFLLRPLTFSCYHKKKLFFIYIVKSNKYLKYSCFDKQIKFSRNYFKILNILLLHPYSPATFNFNDFQLYCEKK